MQRVVSRILLDSYGRMPATEQIIACEHVFADDGIPEYVPPPQIDSRRRPVRNHRFRADATAAA